MILAAHQPNFFPWLGFFNKIYISNTFVLLDDVQMMKTGSTWFNRCYISVNGKSQFYTVPITRPSGLVFISNAHMNELKWKFKLQNTLKMAYGRHPHFQENIGPIFELIEKSSDRLCDFNISVISHFIKIFELEKTRIIRSSDYQVPSSSTQRLIDLVKLLGCDSYLEGGGASGYQEDGLFGEHGISLIKQSYIHPHYFQRGSAEFSMGLSILDPLFNCGVDVTRKLIMGGVQ